MGLHNSNSWAWSTPSELLGVESSTLLERNYQDSEFQQLCCQEAFPQLKHPQVIHNPTGFPSQKSLPKFHIAQPFFLPCFFPIAPP